MKIVCFGDSLTCCGGENGSFPDILQQRFPGHVFINKGVGGETLVDALARLERDVLAEKPEVVLLEFGANDWWRNERPLAKRAVDLETLVRRIQEAGARAVVLGVFGPYLDENGIWRTKTKGKEDRGETYQALEEAVAVKYRCPYLANIQERIVNNRLGWLNANHPNEYGNRHVADAIEPVLEELLGTAALPIRRPDLKTTRDLWREAVELGPERLAVVDRERRLTYAEADEIVESLAAGLRQAAGVPRPKVAVYLPNCLEYYLIYWAVVRLGGVVVPLNIWLKEESLKGIFRSVQPEVLVVRGPRNAICLRAAAGVPCAVFGLEAGGDLRGYEELLKEPEPAPLEELEPEAPAIIMHTSGTTAEPKGAVMRHGDLLFNIMAAINAHGFAPSDAHLLVNPMFHCTALYSLLPVAAYQQAAVVITAETSPDRLMRLVEDEKVTTFLSIPPVFQRILTLRNLREYDRASLRLLAYAGSPMPVAAIRGLQEAFPEAGLHNFFGLTETIAMTHVLAGDEALERPDAIGRLLPFVEAIVVDEKDRPLPAGEVGELLFAREVVISGYYNQPGRLEESLCVIDGREWFRTGDLAAVDEDGYFFIKGRQKDMIIVGGENVFAAEVEAVLMAHENVREAAVKGVPATGVRAFLGELIEAYVVPREGELTEAEVRKFCHDRLPSYKVPHSVRFLKALPRNPAGKVVKAELGP